MNYRVMIVIEQIDHETDQGINIDSHEVVVLSDYNQAMKVWNWVISVSEAIIEAADTLLG